MAYMHALHRSSSLETIGEFVVRYELNLII